MVAAASARAVLVNRRSGHAGRAPRIFLALAALAVALAGTPAGAEELWRVRSGQAIFHFNLDLLDDMRIDLEITGSVPAHHEGLPIDEPYWTFPILSGADLDFHADHDIVVSRGSTSGALRLGGVMVLRDRVSGKETRFDDLEIAHVPANDANPLAAARTRSLHLRSAGSGLVFCELRNSMFDFRRKPELQIHYLNARITEAWARAIGRPELAGLIVGLGEVRAEVEHLSGTSSSQPPPGPIIGTTGLDVSLGLLEDIQFVAHTGTYPTGTTALSMATTSCNVGSVDVPWLAPMQEDHPLIHMALYRLLDGRFEQIGVSWMKHGFYALSNNDCTPCQHPSNGDFLGVGCSDTYDVGNNSSRTYLGPRSEVDPYAGTWTCLASHFAGGQADCVRRHGSSGHGVIDHRLQTQDADLNNPNAIYTYEAYYVVNGDEKLGNNWGSRRCTMFWNGAMWTFTTPIISNPLVNGPALVGWGGANTFVAAAAGDGEVLLSVKTTDLGGGTYHYEYALLNMNSDRRIQSFSLPVLGVPNITNIGFHDNDANGANDWQVTLDGNTITWQTETHAQNPNANALMFGFMFNFRFDADAPPTAVNATLGLFKPGPGTSVDAATTGPTNAVAAVGDRGSHAARVIDARPNPFTHSATIWYQATAGRMDLSIYDAAGRRIRTLVPEGQGTDVQSVTWNGTDEAGARVRSGVYYARLQAGPATAVKSLVLLE